MDTDELENATSGSEGFINCGLIDDILSDSLWEPTVELKCSCGSWTTYGRNCSPALHADHCELRE